MPNQIEIEITADNQKFRSALDGTVKAAQDTGKKISTALDDGLLKAQRGVQTFGDKFRSALGGLSSMLGGRAGILGGIVAVGAGLVKLATDAAAFGAQIADLSTKTGLSARTLSALNTTLKQNDSSLGQFSSAMSILNRQLGEAQAGNDKLARTFQKLGIDVNATSEQALRQVIARYQQLPNEAQKSAFAMQVFGKSGTDLIPTLDSLNGDLDGLIDKMGNLGLTVTPEAAKAAEQLDDNLKILGARAESVKLAIGNALIPVLNQLTGEFTDSNVELKDFVVTLEKAVGLIIPLGPAVGDVRVNLRRQAARGGGTPSRFELLGGVRRPDGTPLPSDTFSTGGGRDGAAEARRRAAEQQREFAEGIRRQLEAQDQLIEGQKKEAELLELNAELRKEIVKAGEVQLAQDKLSVEIDDTKLKQADQQLENLRKIADADPILTNSERLMRGFEDATISTGDAFERLGNNIAEAFTSVRGLLSSLGNAVKQFFSDLVASALQATARSALGSIFGRLGGIFGGGGGGGGLGSIFGGGGLGGTPPFVPSLFGGGGALSGVPSLGIPGAASAGPGSSFFGSLSSSGALPFLGIGLGGALGGSSGFGRALGTIGGGLLGIGLSAAPAAGGLLGAAAPLFSNPITAGVGAALLVGSLVAGLIGKAKQRRRDEEASGGMIAAAHEGINAIIRDIRGDRIIGLDQAASVFQNDVLAQFVSGISSLKTKSVVESRLRNTVPELQRSFQKHIPPEIDAQNRRFAEREAEERRRIEEENRRLQEEQDRQRRNAERFSRQIPEFARGGVIPGTDRGFDSVMALMRPGEMVLTRSQQQTIAAMAGGDVFGRAGVPSSGQQVGNAQAFAQGGVVRGDGDAAVIIENLTIGVGMSQSGAEEIFVAGGSTRSGRQVIVNQITTARRERKM
jgi:hypothetical protein